MSVCIVVNMAKNKIKKKKEIFLAYRQEKDDENDDLN